MLAFTRTYDKQTVLVVVNLSRFSQAVDLDLQNWIGWVPEDTFGHARFPVIRDGPYPITLGAHTSYWLLLTPPEVTGVADGERALPFTNFNGDPAWWFTPTGSRFVDRDLAKYIRNCRWFRSKARPVLSVALLDLVNFPGEGLGHLLIIGFNYAEGPRDLYALPVRVVSGEEARTIEVEYPATVIARIGQDGDLMVDATSSHAFQHTLLDIVAEGRTLAGRLGRLVSTNSTLLTEAFKNGPPQSSRILKGGTKQ